MAGSLDGAGPRDRAETQHTDDRQWWDDFGRQPRVESQGPLSKLANRVLTYARGNGNQVSTVLPYLSGDHGGLVISRSESGYGSAFRTVRRERPDLPFLLDPAPYQKHFATVEKPFILPEGQLEQATLASACDDQLAGGAALALTPSGFVPADGTDVLKAMIEQVVALDRTDVVLVLPLHISLLDRGYFPQTLELLRQAAVPIALILGGQLDPLEQSSAIVPNLRQLAALVPLLALRTDLNALDMVAHGAVCGAIGLSGATRHTIEPLEETDFWSDGTPHLLVPQLSCWWHAGKLSKLFGALPQYAPKCECVVCDGQRLTRFSAKSKTDALAHDAATWSVMSEQLLKAGNLKARAEYWAGVCQNSIANHEVFSYQLNRQEDPIKPQKPLLQWARLAAWPETSATSLA